MNRQAIVKRLRGPIDWARQTRAGDVLERAIRDYLRQHGSIYAAAITYYLLLSLFPLAIVLAAVIGLLARDPGFQQQVVDQIVTVLPSGSGIRQQVEEMVAGVARPRSGLVGLLGLVGALWAASGVFGALRKALNNAFNVAQGYSFIHGRLHDLVSVFVVVLMALTSTVLTITLGAIRSYLVDRVGSGFVSSFWWVINLLLPLVFSFLFFLLLYRLIPNQPMRMRDVWIGALAAAIGFEALKMGFSFYLTNFATYDEVYGALGSLIALLVFVFLSANVMIIGAEIAAEIMKDRLGGGRDSGSGMRGPGTASPDPEHDAREPSAAS